MIFWKIPKRRRGHFPNPKFKLLILLVYFQSTLGSFLENFGFFEKICNKIFQRRGGGGSRLIWNFSRKSSDFINQDFPYFHRLCLGCCWQPHQKCLSEAKSQRPRGPFWNITLDINVKQFKCNENYVKSKKGFSNSKHKLLLDKSIKQIKIYLAGYDVDGSRKKSQEVITIRAVGM